MIDAAMTNPFFQRNQNKNTVGSDSRANWSNENQGVLMIDDYRKKVNFNENNEENIDKED